MLNEPSEATVTGTHDSAAFKSLRALAEIVSSHPIYNALIGIVPAAIFFWIFLEKFQGFLTGVGNPERFATEVQYYAWVLGRIVRLLFLALLITLFLVRRQPVGKASGILPRVAALAGTFMMFLAVLLPAPAPSLAQSSSALFLIILGGALSFLSLGTLGRSFSLMAEARKLVTGGVYGFVRHPLYVSEGIAIAALVVIKFTPFVLVLFIAHIFVQLYRALNEEAVLSATFPEYEQYRTHTPWRFIPGLC